MRAERGWGIQGSACLHNVHKICRIYILKTHKKQHTGSREEARVEEATAT